MNSIDNIPNKVLLEVEKIDTSTLELLKTHPEQIIFLTTKEHNFIGTIRLGIEILSKNNIYNPIIVTKRYNENNLSLLQIKSAIDFGGLLIDGLIDGIYINNENRAISEEEVCETSFQILQSTRARFSTTEYISCPSCGRTKFDLPERVKEVKKATKHLKGLKIAVMGCIVNGPGEMADADYGYIGAGFGKVSHYKGKECIVKNIPEGEAIKKLLEIINNNI